MIDAGRSLLSSRIDALADALEETLRAPLPRLDDLSPATRWVTTGIGGSEGPARVMAAALRASGERHARFAPLSQFACDPRSLRGDVLVVCSQGLSPNARIALQHKGFAHTLAITAATADALRAAGGGSARVAPHPPREEPGLLARVLGPAAATLTALRIVDALTGGAPPEGLVRAVRAASLAPAAALDPRRPVALLCCDAGLELAHGLRWKWLEATRAGDASVFDALGFAHGPLQLCDERGAQVALLTRDDPRERALWDRVRAVLAGTSIEVRTLPATLPGAWAFFEHDARWNATLRATLEGCSEPDLLRWRTQGRDGDLYDLDRALCPDEALTSTGADRGVRAPGPR